MPTTLSGQPTTTNPTPTQLAAFLRAERATESGTNYTAQATGSQASGAYQFEPTTWAEYANASGYAQYANKPAKTAPPAVQDAVAAYMATTYYKQHGGNWMDVAESWYSPANVGKTGVVPYPTAGNTTTITQYGNDVIGKMNTYLNAPTAQPTIRTPKTGTPVPNPTYNKSTASQVSNTPAPTASAQTGTTASTSIDAVLRTAGLTTLIPWANALATTLAAKGLTASGISTTIETQIQTQPAFQARFPGFATRVKNGYPAMTIQEYLTYETKAKAMGRAAGLPTGFMTNTEIGKLVGNNVSITELSTRLTKAYQVVQNAPPETKQLMTTYFGVKSGTLAAYFLTPAKATKLIQNQVTAAQIGTAANQAGFNLSKPVAYTTTGKLPPTGRAGKVTATPLYLAQVGVSAATAQDTFQSLAKLLPLTEGLPGTGTEKTSLGQNTLVNYGFFGTNNEELQNVEQARTSPFRGGGGYAQSAKGVLGAGYGNSQGTTGT